MRDRLEQGIKQQIPDAVVFFEHVERLPNCTAIAFPDVMAEALLYLLYRHGVYATIGGGTIQRLSHVLIASGVSSLLAQSAISFSLSFDTTQEQIDYAIETIVLCVGRLRKCSLAIAGETL